MSHYVDRENKLDMRNIVIPVTPSSLSKFEQQDKISVNAIGYEDGELFPLYLSKLMDEGVRHEVDLLRRTETLMSNKEPYQNAV